MADWSTFITEAPSQGVLISPLSEHSSRPSPTPTQPSSSSAGSSGASSPQSSSSSSSKSLDPVSLTSLIKEEVPTRSGGEGGEGKVEFRSVGLGLKATRTLSWQLKRTSSSSSEVKEDFGVPTNNDVSIKDKTLGGIQTLAGRLTRNRARILAGEVRKSGTHLATRGEHRLELD